MQFTVTYTIRIDLTDPDSVNPVFIHVDITATYEN